jgi:hypothetical protein
LKQYEHEHTKRWAAKVAEADAFAFVTPEYNFSSPSALLNALDYLYEEWLYKPAGFVSYGGVSGGLRSVQVLKLSTTALKMMPLPEAVAIPWASQAVKDGHFAGGEAFEKAATVLPTSSRDGHPRCAYCVMGCGHELHSAVSRSDLDGASCWGGPADAIELLDNVARDRDRMVRHGVRLGG